MVDAKQVGVIGDQDVRVRQPHGRGVRISRLYTQAGRDPFDDVQWESRTARITNPDGTVVFEMKDVEVPASWSQTAVDIAASKYFRKRGLPGVGKETSVRAMVSRVADAIVGAGKRLGGYFAGEEDAQALRDELCYMLVHQIGAFNSPVWFNCGLAESYGIKGDDSGNWCWDPATDQVVRTTDAYTRPAISACFIVTVQDDLMDIAEHVKREMRIFRFGGGSGGNYSNLRGEGEPLSGGGASSGVMSFLDVFDKSAGAIKSGGTTRRAAKMVVLDADHPDIEKFVEWKVREEEKVRALVAAGWSSDFNGEAYRTVGGQNANNSVSVTDEFMRSVTADGDWDLTWRRDGKVARTVKAKQLFRKIAEAAWKCADPGLQFSSTMNRWHTIPASGPIRASNPCSEYLSIDDTSCNLASLNLMKFMRFEGGRPSFDCRAYEHACRSFIVAMDILVDHASYPTREIAQNTHDYRQLGLGYANLGAAVMAQGLAYDSPGARSFAAAVTAVMSGTAYATSADLAASKGAFAGHAKNAGYMRRVMYMHRDAAHAIKPEGPAAPDIVSRAAICWAEAVSRGESAGYRNAQTVVIAPTGTIGLLMDCDTTGVEPDFALVKGKKLAGGGFMKITNGSVDRALETLGYAEAARKAVTDHVLEHGTIEGAPGVDPAHYPAFDCAVSPKADGRAITPMGHVRMVAAVQPFLSGSASKTVNMPESTTVEEIEQIYLESWKLGLKCVSVYRDNCKASQPLAAAGKKDEKKEEPKVEAKVTQPQVKPQPEPRTERRRLPKKRYGFTQEARISGHKVYVRTGEYEDGALGEIFVDTAKDGAAFRSLMNSFAIAVSIGLQHGVPLDEFVNVFTFTKFEPSGPVSDHPNIKNATSIIDFIFRLLALEYLGRTDLVQVPPEEQKTDVGDVAEKIPHAPTEKAKAAMKVVETVKEAVQNAPPSAVAAAYQAAYQTVVNGRGVNGKNGNGRHQPSKSTGSEFCSNCGGMTVRTGTCTTCLTCGTAGGCG